RRQGPYCVYLLYRLTCSAVRLMLRLMAACSWRATDSVSPTITSLSSPHSQRCRPINNHRVLSFELMGVMPCVPRSSGGCVACGAGVAVILPTMSDVMMPKFRSLFDTVQCV